MSLKSLRAKLLFVFAVPTVTLIIVVYISVTQANSLASEFVEVSDVSLPIVTAIEEIKLEGSRLISSSNELILDSLIGDNEEEEEEGSNELIEIENAIGEYQDAILIYEELVNSDDNEDDISDDSELLEDIKTTGQELLDIVATIIEFEQSDESIEEIGEQREALELIEVTFFAAVDEALEEEREELELSKDAVTLTTANFASVLLVVGLLIFFLVVSMTFYIFQTIFHPLNNLIVTANKLRGGNLSVRSEITSQDEFGQFALAFNSMADAIETRDKETKMAREQAERSDQVKSAFLASMSHELRTPLNSIINFSKFIANGVMGPINERQETTINRVIASGQHLLSLINDVLDMSKIEAGSLTLFIEDDIDLNEIIDTALASVEALIDEKPITLQRDIAENLPIMSADRKRITQIFLNVLSNAYKYTAEGNVTVTATVEDDALLFTVKDTGIGIAEEDKDAVFQSFKQTDEGLRQGEGTGLGLPISKSLAEAHGGRLWFTSDVGEGSTFYVSLPIHTTIIEAPLPV